MTLCLPSLAPTIVSTNVTPLFLESVTPAGFASTLGASQGAHLVMPLMQSTCHYILMLS